MQSRPVQVLTEGDRSVVRVPLGPAGEKHCTLDLEAWTAFLAKGHTGNLNCFTAPNQKTYVTVFSASVPGRHQMLARLIMDAKPGERIKYLDGQPLNLRRSNLAIEKIRSWRSAA